jgi:hypothetical protein
MNPIKSFVLLLAMCAGLVNVGCVSSPWRSDSIDQELHRKAGAGDPDSQYRIGIEYTNGEGVTQDYSRGVDWFRKAASQGHVDAQYMVGMALLTGRGVGEDIPEAIIWLRKAATAGHGRAQFQLGDAYVNGRGVEKAVSWGARWIGKAADAGHEQAQFILGALFAKGIGLPENHATALKWIILAEKSGHKQAARAKQNLQREMPADRLYQAQGEAREWRPTTVPIRYSDQPTVLYVQYELTQRQYQVGEMDGIYGPKTERAILSFVGGVVQERESLLRSAVIKLRGSEE